MSMYSIHKNFIIIIEVLAAIHNSNCEKFKGRVFTNGWPEFSAVICHYSPVEEWVSLRLPHTREYLWTKLVILKC